MKILIINGPNLNLLGKREPGIYGAQSFEEYFETLKSKYDNVGLTYYQSNIEGEIKIDFPSAFASGYSMMNGMEQEFDSNTGKVISMFYFSQNGTLNKEGSFTFGPASIRSGNKNYKSNTVNVTVKKEAVFNSNGEISRNQLKQTAFGIIEKNKSVI